MPISILNRWVGLYGTAFTQKTYVYARPDDLRPGTSRPARIHKIAHVIT